MRGCEFLPLQRPDEERPVVVCRPYGKIISREERICRKEFTNVGYSGSCLDFTSGMIVRFLLSKIERRNIGVLGVAGLQSNRLIRLVRLTPTATSVSS
jgi:hypothetical protein